MDASEPLPIRLLGRFCLHRHAGLQSRTADGVWQPVPLGSRALEVLGVLVARRGELVPKDAIMSAVWPDTAVEEHNLTVQVSALRRVLDAGRSGESCIQTVPGRGYRFVDPGAQVAQVAKVAQDAKVAQVAADVSAPVPAPVEPSLARPPRRWLAMLVVGVASIAGVVLLVVVERLGARSTANVAPPRLSLVVLPFTNLGGTPGDDLLAASFGGDVATDLARIPAVTVAKRSVGVEPGRAVDLRKLGAELGVRYVVEGSVRRGPGVLRVNARMTSTETGTQLWADRFEQPFADGNVGLEGMVFRVGRGLNTALTDTESARSLRERPDHPDSLDLVIRARALANRAQSPREHAERLRLSEQAVQLDPRSIPALMPFASELIRLTFRNMGDELPRAARLIADATVIDPNHPYVIEMGAVLMAAQGRYADATGAYQRLLHEYPNSHFAWAQLARFAIYQGHSDTAIEMVETAIDHDPTQPAIWSWYATLSFAHLMLGHHDETINWSRRALAANPENRRWTRARLNIGIAAAHARLGQFDEARNDIAEANRIWPFDTVRMHWPENPASSVYAAQIAQFQDALRLAGHRDHADEDADFGVPPDDTLHVELGGLTPLTTSGATTIRTPDLQRLVAERHAIVIDPMTYTWGRSIPGAVGLRNAGFGSPYSDALQDRLRTKMQALTAGNLETPIVAVGFNSEQFDGHNLARRLVKLGYRQIYWYRGGRESWEAAGLPETKIAAQDW